MDIRNWGMDQVMMLPDGCFGTRRVITMCGSGTLTAPAYDICETGLSERTVVWGAGMWSMMPDTQDAFARFKLGDHLPTTLAEFDTLEDMFPEMACVAGYRSIMTKRGSSGLLWLPMRRMYQTSGRRIVAALGTTALTEAIGICALEISSVPREVPDCLLSV